MNLYSNYLIIDNTLMRINEHKGRFNVVNFTGGSQLAIEIAIDKIVKLDESLFEDIITNMKMPDKLILKKHIRKCQQVTKQDIIQSLYSMKKDILGVEHVFVCSKNKKKNCYALADYIDGIKEEMTDLQYKTVLEHIGTFVK